MDVWLEWARGPAFRASLVFMMLGLIRHAALTLWGMLKITRRAGDKDIPLYQVLRSTMSWLVPTRRIGSRLAYSLTTLAFHIAVILAPLFLAGHIALWQRGLGLSWPAIPNRIADVLTMVAVVTAVLLVIERATARDSRSLSRFQDYALPPIIAVPFATGFLMMHPAWNPFSYEATMLMHVLSADIIFVLVPLTKLSHMILLPGTQLVSELAWHFPPDAGSRVAVTLGKEGEPI